MRSGLVLILELVPVSNLSKNAHRCVINYNRDEVISARRAAGLAYNLGGEDVKTNNQFNTRANSKLVGGAAKSPTKRLAKSKTQPNLQTSFKHRSKFQKAQSAENQMRTNLPKNRKPRLNYRASSIAASPNALKNPKKNLGAWSQAKNGLTLGRLLGCEIDAEQRLIVVAVRNQSTANLRLVPGTPELEIQTTDDKGNALLPSGWKELTSKRRASKV